MNYLKCGFHLGQMRITLMQCMRDISRLKCIVESEDHKNELNKIELNIDYIVDRLHIDNFLEIVSDKETE